MKLKELFEAFSYNSKLDPVVKLKNFSNKKTETQNHTLRIWMIDFNTFGAVSGIEGQEKSYKKFSNWSDAAKFADLENCTDVRIIKASRSASTPIGNIRKGSDCVYAIPPANPDHSFEVKNPELTVKEMTSQVKEIASKLGNWKISVIDPGSQFTSQDKKIAITVELKRKFNYDEVKDLDVDEKYPRSHEILIQGEYYNSPSPSKSKFKAKTKGQLDYWLNQGNVVNFGAGKFAPKFQNGDFESFLAALIKATKPELEKKVIQELYKSGYHRHGRA